MYPILFSIGNLTVYTHGVVIVLGIILGAIIAYVSAKKENLNTEYFWDNIVYSVFFGIIGARLVYFIVYRSQFYSWKELFQIWNGGLVSYGGFFFGGVCLWLLLKYQKSNVARWFDFLAIGFFLGLSIGRIGEVFSGEYNGVYSHLSMPLIGVYNVVPVSLYEAILSLFIFGIIYILNNKASKKEFPGLVAIISVLLYSLGRFIIDWWRVEPKNVYGLSLGQLVSLILFIGTALLFIKLKLGQRRQYDEVK